MRTQLQRGIASSAYHLSVMIGIAVLPLAVQLRRITGVTLPIHALIERTRPAHDPDPDDE